MTITTQAGRRRAGLIVASILAWAITAHAQLSFVLNHAPDLDPQVLGGFEQAANRWSAVFNDPITVTLNIGYDALPTGVLASTSSMEGFVRYDDFRTALTFDQTSAADALAVHSLPVGSFNVLMNRTAENPNGPGSPVPYLDANGGDNNSTVLMTLANARALGIFPSSGGPVDADITFSSLFSYDFNPYDGIDPDKIDFVGIVTHEIGHALGFDSGVDVLDLNSTPTSNPFFEDSLTYVMPLDLFRYSDLSRSYGPGVIDWTADDREKYFSIDGGNLALGLFSTGTVYGDGNQASHWKDNLGIGIMDPTATFGERLSISPTDLTAFDVIGYDLAVPEPATYGVCAATLLAAAIGIRRLRRRC